MTTADWVIRILLTLGVGISVLCAAATVAAKDTFDRLHFLGPVGTVGALCICAAAGIAQGATPPAFKPALIVLALWTLGPLATHAIGRAAKMQRDLLSRQAEEEREEGR